jgi:Tol biopolymer transport system component
VTDHLGTNSAVDEDEEEFERLGRLAGAELRTAAPPDGIRAVERGVAKRRTAIAAAGVAGVTIAVVGVLLLSNSSADDEVPATVPSTTLPPQTTVPPVPVAAPGEQWLAYENDLGDHDEIYLVRPDGTGAHSLTADVSGLDHTHPDWSPDGNRIVFAVKAIDGLQDLWVVGADGTDAEMILDCSGDCVWFDDPAWSPDGSSILFARMARLDGAGVGTLELLDVAAGTTSVVATAAPTDFFAGPQWSPDGRSIVVEVVHRAGSGVYDEPTGDSLSVVALDQQPPTVSPITDSGLFAGEADWSPDGEWIVYSGLAAPGELNKDVFLIRPDGSGVRRLTTLADAGSDAAQPDFSPDGSQVLFVGPTEPDGEDVMLSVPVDGGDVVPATGSAFVLGYFPTPRPVP